MIEETNTALLTPPDVTLPSARSVEADRIVTLLGVKVTDVTRARAIAIMEQLIDDADNRCHAVFFVNAHTLNVSCEQPDFRDVLNSADYVFNDGTGVRWAARQRGIELRQNLCGTDLIPEFLDATSGQGRRLFLLGAADDTIHGAADYVRQRFPGWTVTGCHHGYVHGPGGDAILDEINKLDVDLLLVGMGNPLQERWIHRCQSRLRVPLVIGVGGLFDHWVGKPRRAPLWVRRAGCEWMHKLLLQPHKWRRYLLGNPAFLYRMTRMRASDLTAMNGPVQ